MYMYAATTTTFFVSDNAAVTTAVDMTFIHEINKCDRYFTRVCAHMERGGISCARYLCTQVNDKERERGDPPRAVSGFKVGW